MVQTGPSLKHKVAVVDLKHKLANSANLWVKSQAIVLVDLTWIVFDIFGAKLDNCAF